MEDHFNNTSFLADLIDDLTHEQLVKLLNYIAIVDGWTGPRYAVRGRIKEWRREHGLSK